MEDTLIPFSRFKKSRPGIEHPRSCAAVSPGSTVILQSLHGGHSIYFPVPLLSDSRIATRGVAAGMRVERSSDEASERRTGWGIKQRASCKSRVEARDTSLALSRMTSGQPP